MDTAPNTRSWWDAVVLQAQIRARSTSEMKAGLGPLLDAEFSRHPRRTAMNAPPLPADLVRRIKALWATAGFFRQNVPLRLAYIKGLHGPLEAAHRKLYAEVLAACEAHGPVQREVEIPSFDWQKEGPDAFFEAFVANPHPVVLRGFAKDTEAVRTWQFDRILERFGDESVLLTRAESDGYEGTLREVDDPDVYVHNCEVLFRRHPELLSALELDRLAPYIRKKPAYSQLFIGRQGTGTPFHSAAVWNWFVMVDGQKKWYFVDPRDSVFIHPFPVMGRAASFALCLFPDEYDAERFPAFDWCPYQTATLEPGDVLLNPPWWWHAVRNASETSVAVATRWHGDGRVGRDGMMTEEDYGVSPFFSWLFQAGPGSVPFLHRILRDPSPPATNGHTLRERNNRFADKQRQLALGTVFGKQVSF